MDPLRMHYALCLVRDGAAKDVLTKDKFALVQERLVEFNGETDTFTITDKGKDKIRRKGN